RIASRSARATTSRAAALTAGVTASSRSQTTASADDASAFASFRSSLPGAKRSERRCGSSIGVASGYVRHSAGCQTQPASSRCCRLTGFRKSDINAEDVPPGRSWKEVERMKAVRFHEFGGVDVLRVEEVDDPSAGPGEVLVRIRAAGLNHLDVDVRDG